MADSDAIRDLHRARLAAANQAFQQFVEGSERGPKQTTNDPRRRT
jgi:hypothetical protein